MHKHTAIGIHHVTVRVLSLVIVGFLLAVGCTAAPTGSMQTEPTLMPTVPPTASSQSSDFGGGPIILPRDETTEAEMIAIRAEVLRTIDELIRGGEITAYSAEVVTFTWPLRAANGLDDYGYHGVSGFVDHNPATGSLRDYTCGTRSYDLSSGYNHQGTDYFTFPFPWIKVDNDLVEIIAAAPGTLVFKRDGQYDRQCAMTGALSNAVVIRHADGSLAHYLHMKKNSVTTKAVGEEIGRGEYLGVVASSGSSTGPHLHFEVRDVANRVVDPYQGDCNPRPSMWAEQPPYYDSAVIAVHTGSAPPQRRSCPQQSIPNYQQTFDPDETVTFVTTYRDQRAGQTSTYRILQPGGSVYDTWEHASTRAHYSASYWYWTKELDRDGSPPAGTWRFEVDFVGETYGTEFYIIGPSPRTITVTHPNGGEGWFPGTILPITWDTNRVGTVDIDLYADGVFATAAVTGTRNDGVTFWAAPDNLTARRDYTIRITNAADPVDYDTSDAPFTIAPVPVAGFTVTPTTGTAPLTVAFEDDSTSLIDGYRWDFGDGMTSTLESPMHVYADPGAITVTLTVTGPTGTDTVTRTDLITVGEPPLTADFTAAPRRGTPPLTVTFTELAGGPPIENYLWDFGDGTTATEPNPVHTYADLGVHTVTLTVATPEEQAQVIKSSYIQVTEELQVYLPLLLR